MIILNTKRHLNKNENGPMTYLELITDLPRPHRKIDNTGTFFCVVELF